MDRECQVYNCLKYPRGSPGGVRYRYRAVIRSTCKALQADHCCAVSPSERDTTNTLVVLCEDHFLPTHWCQGVI
jgi:hypothetical protein